MLFAGIKIRLKERDLNLKVEIAPGELADKISILAIKCERMTDDKKLKNVKHEYNLLVNLWNSSISNDSKISDLLKSLRSVNEVIWQIEDDIRDHERRQDFGATFIACARAVYHNNDQRAAIKREINQRLNSVIIEEKSYTPYV